MMQQAPTQTVLACSQCRRILAQSDLVQIAGKWVCGDCKPGFLSRVVAGTATSSRWHYGGFWIRFVAVFLDGLLMQVLRVPISLLILGAVASPLRTPGANPAAFTGAMLTLTGISMLIAVLYEATMIRYFGATLGKMAVGVKVVRSDGSGISWGISIGRYFMKIVSAFILLIGYIMAGFDEEKRALHDRVCDTRVVYKRSIAAA